jgi:hypothetical protein
MSVSLKSRPELKFWANSLSPLKLRSCTNVIKPVKARFLAIASTAYQGFWLVIENGARSQLKRTGKNFQPVLTGFSF